MQSKKIALLVMALTLLTATSLQAGNNVLVGYWDTYAGPGDYTAALAPYANVSYIALGADTADVPKAITEASNYGMKSIVSVQGVFFQNQGNSPNLINGWGTNWSNFAQSISAQVAANDVAAFYLYDEPDGAGVSIQALSAEANAVRTAFPSVPLMIIYQPGNYLGLSLVDWAGIDCYSNGQWTCANGQSYSAAYSGLRSRLNSNQRTVLVPQAGYQSNSLCCNAALEQELQAYVALSIGDPDVVAIIPFIWPNATGFQGLSSYNSGAGSLGAYYTAVSSAFKNGYAYPFSTSTPAYEFYAPGTNNHFVTTSVLEGLSNGFNLQGIAWNVLPMQASGTMPLYRCHISAGNRHFSSTSSSCEGQIVEGVYGYIYSYQAANTSPLVRYYDPYDGDFYDSVATVTPPNYQRVGVLGYVPNVGVP
ncbi:hypothetical protein ISN76_07600 [Dyella halodurans]|uniref:DUF5648 domain-containing protein n=1 Tax=Dyella halodurans TaxID=1920171 RepID=A0ABV9C4D8_9GAMM|nr:hypothetical protein [Dyella halodurans]